MSTSESLPAETFAIEDDGAPRSMAQAIGRGLRSRCPRCGEGKLFGHFLKVAPACTVCGQSFEGQRADDLPPYITIFLAGHIMVALYLAFDTLGNLSLVAQMVLWPALASVLVLVMMQPIKGATIGYQWAMRMHGFDPAGDAHGDVASEAPRPSRATQSS